MRGSNESDMHISPVPSTEVPSVHPFARQQAPTDTSAAVVCIVQLLHPYPSHDSHIQVPDDTQFDDQLEEEDDADGALAVPDADDEMLADDDDDAENDDEEEEEQDEMAEQEDGAAEEQAPADADVAQNDEGEDYEEEEGQDEQGDQDEAEPDEEAYDETGDDIEELAVTLPEDTEGTRS